MKPKQILLAFLLLAANISCSQKPGDSTRENYPPEVRELTDKLTGASIRQLTSYKGNSHHFYFTNPAWFDKGQKLLFSSDRNNKTNLFSVDLNDYKIQQITDLEPLIFPKEIGFFGACKNPARDHEYWHADGETLGYHGTREDGSTFLGRIRYDNTGLVEVDFSKRTGHIHSNNKDLIVGDGGAVIRLWKWNGETYDGPRILCEHKSSMKTQHSHPHPRFNAAGDKVIYTSDVTGYCNVYQVDLMEFESLPRLDE